jgi:endonuclease YncB( thermonuclease family)
MIRLLFFFVLVWKLAALVGRGLGGLLGFCLRRGRGAPAPASQSYVGYVTRVVDGDTVRCRVDGAEYAVRLLDIDAPEHDQQYGAESTAFLKALVQSKWVEVQVTGTDCYGRTLAHLFVDRQWVNAKLVAAGVAWSIAEGPVRDTFRRLQTDAMKLRLGLWAADRPMHPRDHRALSA